MLKHEDRILDHFVGEHPAGFRCCSCISLTIANIWSQSPWVLKSVAPVGDHVLST